MRSFGSVCVVGLLGAVVFLSGPAWIAACASSTNYVPNDAGSGPGPSQSEARDGGADDSDAAGLADAGSLTDGAIVSDGGCTIEFSPRCPVFDDKGCSSAISLKPGSGEYCTIFCETPADCPKGVLCNPNAGVCLPPCTSNAACAAMGFRRCDEDGGTCTTL